jgi:hypothetical protein
LTLEVRVPTEPCARERARDDVADLLGCRTECADVVSGAPEAAAGG